MNNIAIASIYQYNHDMVHCIIDATKIPLIKCKCMNSLIRK